jgi:hypothetical protein
VPPNDFLGTTSYCVRLKAEAEDRIAELEAENQLYREKSERAEQWLHRVYTEIEDRFLQQSNGSRSTSGAPQRPQKRSR